MEQLNDLNLYESPQVVDLAAYVSPAAKVYLCWGIIVAI